MPALRPRFRPHLHGAAGALLVAAIGAGTASASVISDQPTLPPANGVYAAAAGPQCFPTLGICVDPGKLSILSVIDSTFDGSGQHLKLDTQFNSMVTDLGHAPLGPVVLTGEIDETVAGRSTATDTGTWTASLDSLDLSGSVLGSPVEVGLDPDPLKPSIGETSIVPVGSDFLISSFFDVFVEIQIGPPGGPLTATRGPIRAVLVPAPEPGTLLLLTSALLGTLFVSRRRKPETAA
jgi:hypothetical protein